MTVNQAQDAPPGAGPVPSSWATSPDPGDLSRRLAARRAELRLSVIQVATRARVDRRYLEYLENFPSHPDAGTLRHLAAALCTTPAVLLGAGQGASPAVIPERPAGARPGTLNDSARPSAISFSRPGGSAG